MRSFLFQSASKVGEISVITVQYSAVFTINFIRFVSNTTLQLIAFLTRISMAVIDKERFENLEAYYSQKDMHIELKTLNSLMILKEDAIAQKRWTGAHTEALQMLGNTLINECDWEENRMHAYMRSVVESIPGLHYVSGMDDDDDDDSVEIG